MKKDYFSNPYILTLTVFQSAYQLFYHQHYTGLFEIFIVSKKSWFKLLMYILILMIQKTKKFFNFFYCGFNALSALSEQQ